MTVQKINVRDILDKSAAYLASSGVEKSRLVAEMLLARLLGCPRLNLCLKHDEVVPESFVEAMRRGIKRAARGEPVQYILGDTQFMGHIFKVDRRALIPRPETEQLVEQTLACRELWQSAVETPCRIVDVGTGCGCIALSLALAHPDALIAGIDTSEEALALARENKARLLPNGRLAFVHGELADIADPESLDAVVANLPYVAETEWQALSPTVRDFEPSAALAGGTDGLEVIRSVAADAAMALRAGGRLFLEIGDKQAARVQALLEDEGFENVVVRQDLADRDRIVSAILKSV